MRQERGLQTAVIAVLAVAILVMSVGFALFNQNLTINGTATFSAAKWDVKFDSTSVGAEAASTVTASSGPTVTATNVTYAVTLEKPGDVYSFHVNVINDGTIDAVLKGITITNDQSSASYIEHTVTYAGTDFTTSTTTIPSDIATLAKKSNNTPGSRTVIVTVRYLDTDAVAASLPTEQSITANLGVTLAYESAAN